MAAALANGLRGKSRRTLMQLHRLIEFEKAFDAYLAGRVGPKFLKFRAQKLLAIGLPRIK